MNTAGSGLRSNPRLLFACRVVLMIAATVSLGLQLYAGRNSPQHVVVLLVAAWVLSPFVVLASLTYLGRTWATSVQSALAYSILVTCIASVAAYAIAVLRPLASKPPAFLFVAVPPASLLLVTVALLVVRLLRRRP